MNKVVKYSQVSKQRAFTLLEVLVALAVLAMGLGAVMKVSASQATQLAYIKNKTIALWVAENKANEIQMEDWPETGTRTGREFMATQEWQWKVKISNTADKDLRRMDIEVNHITDKGEPLVRFIAFKGRQINKEVVP